MGSLISPSAPPSKAQKYCTGASLTPVRTPPLTFKDPADNLHECHMLPVMHPTAEGE